MTAIPRATIDALNAERTIPLERYQEDGCESRFEYLESLAEENGVDFDVVLALLGVLPPEEDFDGLVVMLEDYGGGYDL